MNFEEYSNEIANWNSDNHKRFFEKTTWNVTIGIRSILSNNDLNSEAKLEAIRCLNEFLHSTNEHKFLMNHSSDQTDLRVLKVFENAKFFSSKNEIVKLEILEIIKLSYETTKNHRNF